ncbi:unnamed protein product [Calypogeia fissa]
MQVLYTLGLAVALASSSCIMCAVRVNAASCGLTADSPRMDDANIIVEYIRQLGAEGQKCCLHNCNSHCADCGSVGQARACTPLPAPAEVTNLGQVHICGPCGQCISCTDAGNALNDVLVQCVQSINNVARVAGSESVDGLVLVIDNP